MDNSSDRTNLNVVRIRTAAVGLLGNSDRSWVLYYRSKYHYGLHKAYGWADFFRFIYDTCVRTSHSCVVAGERSAEYCPVHLSR